jgi:hypothetical protein
MTENNAASGLPGNQKGVSNTTLAALIILALIVTIIGTFGVLYGVNSQSTTHVKQGGSGIGVVSLTIIPLEQSTPNQSSGVASEVKK